MSTRSGCRIRRVPLRGTLVALAALGVVGASACGWRNNSASVGQHATPVTDLPAAQRYGPVSGELKYLLQPGDQLDIKFFYNPELNDNAIVRPDGGISLQLVGDQVAAGRTPAELGTQLKLSYEPYLKRTEVAVIVRKYGVQKVYVGGEVGSPGAIPIEGRPPTALEAIMAAGGFRPSAARDSVVVLRNESGTQPIFIKLDLQSHLEQAMLGDIALRPYDIVFVPQTSIGEVAQFFDLYFNKIFPIYKNLGFTFFYNIAGVKAVP
jgi:polysaccharide export outer membrane protein